MEFIPNILTITRLIISPIILIIFLSGENLIAIVLIIFAGITDWLDGMIARKFDCQSNFGEILDPVADKVLIFFICIGLFLKNILPKWLLFLIIGRDILILIFSFLILWKNWNISTLPLYISKINTVIQILTLLCFLVLYTLKVNIQNFLITKVIILTLVFTTISSGLCYIYRFFSNYISNFKENSLK